MHPTSQVLSPSKGGREERVGNVGAPGSVGGAETLTGRHLGYEEALATVTQP